MDLLVFISVYRWFFLRRSQFVSSSCIRREGCAPARPRPRRSLALPLGHLKRDDEHEEDAGYAADGCDEECITDDVAEA